jgi:hypothetical protein
MIPVLFELSSFSPVTEHSKLNVYILALSILLMTVAFAPAAQHVHSPGIGVNKKQLPVRSTDFIVKNKLQQSLFNDYNFGGYLIWRLFPASKIFVDGRLEIYAGEVMDDYISVINSKNYDSILNKYAINTIMIRPGRKVNKAIIRSRKWDMVYFDNNTVIYVRKNYRTDLMRIRNISPWSSWKKKDIQQGIEEAKYLIKQNPDFAGAKKILTGLYIEQKNAQEPIINFNEYFQSKTDRLKYKKAKKT